MSSPFRPTVTHLRSLPPDERRRRLRRSAAAVFGAEMRAYACRVLEDVVAGGDDAVALYTARWDGVDLAPAGFVVGSAEIEAARDAVSGTLLEALEVAIGRVRRFNEWLLPPEMTTVQLEDGITTGIQYRPCHSAGLYVPSGKGSFPSMMIAMGTPAVVAGVERIAVVLPPRPDGSVDPAVLAAADLLGIRQIFRCNGAAGVAALAVGTGTIPRTQLVGGPGSPVIAAVQQASAVFGATPLVALGPSEAIVLADATADPASVVVDLLTEAEHGADSAVMLVATDAGLANAVAGLLPQYLDRLPEPRRSYALTALTDLGGLFLAADLDEALAWINSYAPEHLQLAVADPLAVAGRVRHAGEILLGQCTPFAAANYAIGTPAALPTGGAALAASGITVLSFLKATAIAGLTLDGLRAVAPVASRLGWYEGFPAHVQAITHREPHLA
ncbi:MAG: histidinol dehydrogenase [Armatimonadetes bacterium]|nr:histidinol dehydrogenase [Armatimonadota bacterium]